MLGGQSLQSLSIAVTHIGRLVVLAAMLAMPLAAANRDTAYFAASRQHGAGEKSPAQSRNGQLVPDDGLPAQVWR
jgi:hypothetical protein